MTTTMRLRRDITAADLGMDAPEGEEGYAATDVIGPAGSSVRVGDYDGDLIEVVGFANDSGATGYLEAAVLEPTTTSSDQLDERLQDLHRLLYSSLDLLLYERTLNTLGPELCKTLFGFVLGSELGLNGRADLEAESYVTTWVDGLRELARTRGLLPPTTTGPAAVKVPRA